MKEFIISENDSGQRLDKFVSKAVPLLTKSLMYKYIRLKRIKLNLKRAEIGTVLCCGDRIQMYINDEFFVSADAPGFLSAPSAVRVIYEDKNILLCDKPAGLVVHEDNDGENDTLINRIQHYLYDKKEYIPESENSFTPSLCNRIDRNTCGIVIAAKNAPALREMNLLIRSRLVKKQYLCVALGHFDKRHALETAFLKKDEKTNKVSVTDQNVPGSKPIKTEYTVLREKNGKSLLCVTLHTGRTHQIRAHLAHLGHPLLGDGKYGYLRDGSGQLRRQALCSYKLSFSVPEEYTQLRYLDTKSFEISEVWFANEFNSGKL